MFKSALSEIFQRFGTAIKITLVPILIILAMIGGIGAIFYSNFAATNSSGPQFGLLMFFLALSILVVFLILFAWTAISWHRAVLLNEPVGFFPSLKGLPIGRYIGNSILIAVILLIPGFIIVFLMGIFVSSFFALASTSGIVGIAIATTLFGAVAGIFLQFLWLRMAVILPGSAVDRPIGIGDGWSATGEISGSIFWLSVIMTAITTAVSLLLMPFQFVAPIVVLIVQIPFNFFVFIFGISIVTEIYKRVLHVDDSASIFE